MLNNAAVKSFLVFLLFAIYTHQALSDTSYASPIKSYALISLSSTPRFDSLDDLMDWYNQDWEQRFNDCMDAAAAVNENHWVCMKYSVDSASEHPQLSDGIINGEPQVWKLTGQSHMDRSHWTGHDITDGPWEVGASTILSCPKGYQFRRTGPTDNQTFECIKTEFKTCSVGNPIDIFTGKKTEVEIDYQSPNGALKVERRYLGQDMGWLMSAEPRIRYVRPGATRSLAGMFTGINQFGSLQKHTLLLSKRDPDSGTWREGEVDMPIEYINRETSAGHIYLWLNGQEQLFLESGDIYLREGGTSKDTIIEPVSDSSIEGAVWRLRQSDGSLSYFGTNGRIIKRFLAMGDSVDYQYDGFQLSSKTDQSGRTLTYQYSSSDNSRLESVVLPNGQRIHYEYNNNDDMEGDDYWLLKRVIWPDGSKIEYAYNETEHVAGNGNALYLTGKYDAYDQRVGTYKYDMNGHAYYTEGFKGANRRTAIYTRNRTVNVTDANDIARAHIFRLHSNGQLLLAGKWQPAGSGSTQAQKYITYEDCGKPKGIVNYNGNSTQHAYDPATTLRTVSVTGITGLPGTVFTEEGATLPPGASKRTTQWDNALRKPFRIAEPNLITTTIYNGNPDPFNNDTPADCSNAQIDGDPLPVVCRVVRQTTTDDNGSQGLNAAFDPNTPTRQRLYTYNDLGQLLTTTSSPDYLTETTFNYYPQEGASHKKGDLQSVTNALGHTVEYLAYDGHGNPTQIRDANGTLSEMTYDHRNRLRSHTIAGLTTTLVYDLNGNLTEVSTPDGQTLTREYDGAGRLSALVDTLLNRMELGYDLEGNQLSKTIYDATGITLFANTHQYDAVNRLEKTIEASLAETDYGYDPEGNLTTITDAKDEVTTQRYDANDRLIQITDAKEGVVDTAYDAQDNPTSIQDQRDLETTYSYNGFGELITLNSPDTGITTYEYDEAGNRINQTDARGLTTRYEYDALNRLTAIHYPDTSLD
ncbi:MAG: hypothetical protein KZQ89_21440, partial [Candidatus Thiodiazotropha sp. (ex Lucinoma kastoroae)]|nr:hypothetical protein [Candidatus Thiodiazotropha sp. (ex Lucinoma kastoroae)]